MERDRTAVTVMPSMPEYGITTKDVRGILTHQGKMPESVAPLQSALSRIATSLNVDLNQSSETLVKAFQQAIDSRAEVAKAGPSNDVGFAPT